MIGVCMECALLCLCMCMSRFLFSAAAVALQSGGALWRQQPMHQRTLRLRPIAAGHQRYLPAPLIWYRFCIYPVSDCSSAVAPGSACPTGLERCLGGSSCINGFCQCPFGTVAQLGDCQPLQAAPAGGPCSPTMLCSGLAVCVAGTCQCPSGMIIQVRKLFLDFSLV